MNVAEYILKPINAEELTGVLQKLKADLDRERAERQDVELLRSRYRDYLPVLRELFFTNLLEGRLAPGTEAEQALGFQGLGGLDYPFGGTIRFGVQSGDIYFVLSSPLFNGILCQTRFVDAENQPNPIRL